MPKVRLTDGPAGNVWRKAPAGKTLPPLHDTICPGLELRIGPRGGSYLVSFRVKGSPERLRRKLGTTATIDLPEAREKARDVLAAAKRGIHPDETKRQADAEARAAAQADARAAASTLLAVGEAYLSDQLRGGGAGLASRDELRRKLMKDLAPWHALRITEITRADVRALVRAKAQASPAAANRLLSFISRLFSWAAAADLIDAVPTVGIGKPAEEARRERYLSADEIRVFWKACDRLGDPAGRLFKLCLVLGQRRGEVAGMRRSELGTLPLPAAGRQAAREADAWLLPPERTKARRAHAVPLSRLAKALIDSAPKPKDDDGKELEFDHVMPSGRRGDQPVSGWSRYRLALDQAIGEILAEEADQPFDPELHRLEPWHVHDLRATCASHLVMPPLSVPQRVVSRLLNHSEGFDRSMTSKYVRYSWDGEAADALERWGQRLEQIVGANVHPLRREGA